jgi:hypothetical protein
MRLISGKSDAVFQHKGLCFDSLLDLNMAVSNSHLSSPLLPCPVVLQVVCVATHSMGSL